jgi:hypothetical protein
VAQVLQDKALQAALISELGTRQLAAVVLAQ